MIPTNHLVALQQFGAILLSSGLRGVLMGNVRFPLSGDVSQTINPWTWVYNMQANQIGLFNLNIDLGQSSDPDVEYKVLSVASYGKQLGRIGDVLEMLIARLPKDLELTKDERDAVSDFETMRREIAAARKR
jgi:hypothetical protein